MALMVLGPIFEADFHPNSYGFRPGLSAHQALDTIVKALRSGRLEVVDVDVSKYFESICHNRLMRLIARRTSDGSVLHLLPVASASVRNPVAATVLGILRRAVQGEARAWIRRQPQPVIVPVPPSSAK